MEILTLIKDLIHERKTIWQLAKNDSKARFAASGLGVVWVFLQPLLNILVLWFVFQIGFKSMPVENTPFIVWYIPAFLSWNYFSEGLSQTTGSLIEYSYLLKKVNFKATIIPVIKVFSAAIIHMGFIVFIVGINLVYRRVPTLFYLQMLYYFICVTLLLVGLGLMLSSVSAILRDVINLVGVVLQIGFWATPLFWDPGTMDPIVQKILKLNPLYYICMGYRESVVYNIGFWRHPYQTFYFWMWVIMTWIVGIKLFNKSRPFFDDVL